MELNLEEQTKKILDSFHSVNDLVIREIRTEFCNGNIFYIDGMIDANELYMSVVKPLVEANKAFDFDLKGINGVLTCSSKIMSISDFEKILYFIAGGDAVLLIDKASTFIMIGVRRPNSRTTSEPPTSTAIKGPREGFVEDIKQCVTN